MASHTFPVLSRLPRLLPGISLSLGLALLAMGVAAIPAVGSAGISALTLAIVLGIVAGNTFFPALAGRAGDGVDYAKGTLLRLGIVLYGFRIGLHDLLGVGVAGLLIDILMVASVFLLAVLLGTRWLKLDRQTAMLIGAGSAICGAAAVLATEPVLKAPAHKVSVAVATVVVFGTLGMFLYPLLYPYLNISEHAYGLFVGSTVHEVAQVVVAGKAVSEAAAATAVIEKMLRVMLLAPFLLALSAWWATRGGEASYRSRIVVPWFAVLFIGVSVVQSLLALPAAWTAGINQLDTVLLATAMAALGLRTHVGAIRQAGPRPLLLAVLLFGYLLLGGGAINYGVHRLLG